VCKLSLVALALGTAAACGSRTGLPIPLGTTSASSSSSGGSSGSSSGGGSSGSGSSSGGVTPQQDPCPSAVSGPKPMFGNCSTRDGRSRAPAPTAPHVTWTTKLPTDSSGSLGLSALSTDGSGNAYVVTTGQFDESIAALRRVRASDGTIVWSRPISPDQESTTPIVLASGGIDMFAYAPGDHDSVFTFDATSGSSTSTTFGFSLYDAPPYLAVGRDGSLYVTHQDGVGTAHTTTYVSRVGPDGAVRWSTVDLATLGPLPQTDGDVSPSILALGRDDLVVIFTFVLQKSGQVSVAHAFDPATGAVRWSQPIDGELIGGPVVRSDGTIVAVVDAGPAGTSNLAILQPDTGALTEHPLSMNAFEIYAVTVDGVVISGADAGQGVTGLVALADDGSILWTTPGSLHATIASDGTVVAFGPTLRGLDPATGTAKWEVAPPQTASCIADAALMGDGGIVALQCDGTLFGASD
jgi:hypothetical protein